MMWVGVCMVASEKIPTAAGAKVRISSAWEICSGVERMMGRVTLRRVSSEGSLLRVPAPKTTRIGVPLYSKELIVVVLGGAVGAAIAVIVLLASDRRWADFTLKLGSGIEET